MADPMAGAPCERSPAAAFQPQIGRRRMAAALRPRSELSMRRLGKNIIAIRFTRIPYGFAKEKITMARPR